MKCVTNMQISVLILGHPRSSCCNGSANVDKICLLNTPLYHCYKCSYNCEQMIYTNTKKYVSRNDCFYDSYCNFSESKIRKQNQQQKTNRLHNSIYGVITDKLL